MAVVLKLSYRQWARAVDEGRLPELRAYIAEVNRIMRPHERAIMDAFADAMAFGSSTVAA